jgi:RNA polymerase sigma factor FliA
MEAIEQLQWKKFKLNNNINYRDIIITKYTSLVKFIACDIYRSISDAVELADLESYGYIGLMDAIKKFNPERNIKFETYAKFRIRGAILDGMRKIDWLSRALRNKMKKKKQILDKSQDSDNTVPELLSATQNFKKYPKNDDFNYVIISYEELDELNKDFSKYNEPERNPLYASLISPDDFVENVENISYLSKAIKKLKNIEKKIVYYHYFESMTFRETGRLIGLTEQRAFQIHKKALQSLRQTWRA